MLLPSPVTGQQKDTVDNIVRPLTLFSFPCYHMAFSILLVLTLVAKPLPLSRSFNTLLTRYSTLLLQRTFSG